MRKWFLAALLASTPLFLAALLVLTPPLALAQNNFPTPGGATAGGSVGMCLNAAGLAVACGGASAIAPGTVIQGNGTGTVGAVTGTLTSATGKTAYICGFAISATGTGSIGAITITGLLGGTQTYQAGLSAAGGVVAQAQFSPCLPASGTNVNIVITTTADASATAVDVNSWGFLL
jgi:hypothetical protein